MVCYVLYLVSSVLHAGANTAGVQSMVESYWAESRAAVRQDVRTSSKSNICTITNIEYMHIFVDSHVPRRLPTDSSFSKLEWDA